MLSLYLGFPNYSQSLALNYQFQFSKDRRTSRKGTFKYTAFTAHGRRFSRPNTAIAPAELVLIPINLLQEYPLLVKQAIQSSRSELDRVRLFLAWRCQCVPFQEPPRTCAKTMMNCCQSAARCATLKSGRREVPQAPQTSMMSLFFKCNLACLFLRMVRGIRLPSWLGAYQVIAQYNYSLKRYPASLLSEMRLIQKVLRSSQCGQSNLKGVLRKNSIFCGASSALSAGERMATLSREMVFLEKSARDIICMRGLFTLLRYKTILSRKKSAFVISACYSHTATSLISPSGPLYSITPLYPQIISTRLSIMFIITFGSFELCSRLILFCFQSKQQIFELEKLLALTINFDMSFACSKSRTKALSFQTITYQNWCQRWLSLATDIRIGLLPSVRRQRARCSPGSTSAFLQLLIRYSTFQDQVSLTKKVIFQSLFKSTPKLMNLRSWLTFIFWNTIVSIKGLRARTFDGSSTSFPSLLLIITLYAVVPLKRVSYINYYPWIRQTYWCLLAFLLGRVADQILRE